MSIELTQEYLSTLAESKAKEFLGDGRDKVDKNQLRKFYDDFKLIERRVDLIESDEGKFKKDYLPLIKFMKSKIAYNAGRKVGNTYLINAAFKNHIDKEIDRIESSRDFFNFMKHYEAIIGYYTFQAK